jgi:L-fucose mutarotase/ribose pyranase (RbsD/FucU family)
MKYTVKQKQEKLNQLKDTKHFDADLQLFQRRFPRHNLHRELARINSVNREKLCGQMIYALLDAFSAEEILHNRGLKTNVLTDIKVLTEAETEAEKLETAKTKLIAAGIDIEKISPEVLEKFAVITGDNSFETAVQAFKAALQSNENKNPAENLNDITDVKVITETESESEVKKKDKNVKNSQT